jgi:hypothetical protein
MDNIKPSVFPTPEQRAKAENDAEIARLAAFEREKAEVTNYIYDASKTPPPTPEAAPVDYSVQGHGDAVEMMRRRTEYQMSLRNNEGVVQHPELAEKPPVRQITREEIEMNKRTEEQMRLRDEALARNREQTQKYHQQSEASMANLNKPNNGQNMNQQNTQGTPNNYQPSYVPPTPPSKPPVNNGYGENYGQNPSSINPAIYELSQPNYNSPFDVIPLPSEGKLYRSKKPSVRIGYMTTADENILTSPNLLESGEFLEILINRKILEPELRYKDLTVGDRNAIMLWLRATAYGEMYPVTLFDENNVPFEVEINLNDLKTKKLGAEPNSEGLFDYQFPLSKDSIKFRFPTVGETEAIEKKIEAEKANGVLVNNTNTYTLQKLIVEVNGERNPEMIRDYVSTIRIGDARKFAEYVDKIESGVDLTITVGTPGGGSVTNFLPLNFGFFWPNIKL